MKKKLFVISCFSLLTACGGSDSGGSNDVAEPPYGYCSNEQEMTCTYPVSQLELKYTMYLHNDNSMLLSGSFYSEYKPPVFPYEMLISDIERVEVLQDGVLLTRSDPLSLQYAVLDTSASMYEFNWYRNDHLVGYSSIDRLPEPINNISVLRKMAISIVSVSWDGFVDHTYTLDVGSLSCYNENALVENIAPNNSEYVSQEVSPSISIDLTSQYNKTIQELQASYESCNIIANISGTNDLAIPVQHVGNITLDFKAEETVLLNLF
ncbi:hypothetical protein [Aliivibrio sifiae]|uniref:hypothetical protein n=1 Tax=Aliivibrio sifiae TaxID=566293 RepID=UPI0021586D58|nr:hypothetical protein [Aliivibrio sifiae]